MGKDNEFIQPEISSGSSITYWLDTVNPIKYFPLRENLETDVVIVGGGIAGVTIAYQLAMKGKKVALVEDGFIGSGETGRTTAHLTAALDDRYFELKHMFGEKGIKLAAESHSKAIDLIEEIVRREDIDCDFERVPGYLFLHPSDKKENLEKEFETVKKAGLKTEWLDLVPGLLGIKSPAIKFHHQAQFHIMKYMAGLCKALEKMDAPIFTETHAKAIDHHGIQTTDGFSIKAGHVVIATNTPVNDLVVIHTKQSPSRTYAIGCKVIKGSVQKALWWDTGDQDLDKTPYHYARIQSLDEEYDLLITGGEDHAVGNTDDTHVPEEKRFIALERWTKQHFPVEEVIYRWSGQVMEPMDSLAFIGRNPWDKNNVYVVTGDSGNGLTHGTIAAMLIPDLILGKKNPWEKIYDPTRFKIFSAGGEFIKYSIDVMKEYFRDIPGMEELPKLDEMKPGEGEVIRINGEKLAIYKDQHDHFHILSAVCPHLQCIVEWNNEEKSWDCPCHGSRFSVEGKVLNGPANTDLPCRHIREKSKVNH